MNEDFGRLKLAGFKWEEDAIKGIMLQICFYTTSEYRMDIWNTTLHACYCTNKSSFSLSEIFSMYQNLITTCKTFKERKNTVRTLAASFQKMAPDKPPLPVPILLLVTIHNSN
jgi:hypothetical protein